MKSYLIKLNKILTKKELTNSVILLIFFISVSVLESLTLLFISKLVLLIQSPNYSNPDILFRFFEIVKTKTKTSVNFFTFSSILFLCLFVLKTFLYLILAKRQSEFIFQTQAEISKRIFRKYFQKNYLNFKQNNSSIIIRNLTTEVSQFVQLLQSLIVGVNELLMILSLIIVLIIQDFQSTIILILLILSPTLIFRYFTKNKILIWGKNRQYSEGKKIQTIQETHGLFKELIIYNKINEVTRNYDLTVNSSAESGLNQYFSQQIPKYFLEFFSILSLFVIGFVMFKKGDDISLVFSIISLLVASSFKLIPSVNRFIGSIQSFKYCIPTVDTLNQIFSEEYDKKFIEGSISKINFSQKIVANNIQFSYNDYGDKLKFDFTINKGEKIGIVGESGSGKSTLINLLLGLIEPKGGFFSIDNQPLSLYQNSEWYSKIGYVPQDIFLVNDSIKKNIALFSNEFDLVNMNNSIRLAKIQKFISDLNDGIEFVITENGANLSGGQKQRIGIARALFRNPEILILDEATSALNEELEREILNDLLFIKEDLTIIMITHRKSSLLNCNKIFQISNSQLNIIK